MAASISSAGAEAAADELAAPLDADSLVPADEAAADVEDAAADDEAGAAALEDVLSAFGLELPLHAAKDSAQMATSELTLSPMRRID
ncbi:MAG: hypothetical protein ABI912_02575 [Actinomycetota bacterium]